MDSSSPPGRFWRFSLREMLLLMVAIGACISAWLSHRPVQQTGFYRRFDLVKHIHEFCEESGIAPHISGFSGSHSQTGQIVSGEQDFVVQAKQEIRAGLINHLLKACETDLAQDKCRIVFRGLVGEQAAPSGVMIIYRKGGTSGSICIYSSAVGSDAIELRILRHESRD